MSKSRKNKITILPGGDAFLTADIRNIQAVGADKLINAPDRVIVHTALGRLMAPVDSMKTAIQERDRIIEEWRGAIEGAGDEE